MFENEQSIHSIQRGGLWGEKKKSTRKPVGEESFEIDSREKLFPSGHGELEVPGVLWKETLRTW